MEHERWMATSRYHQVQPLVPSGVSSRVPSGISSCISQGFPFGFCLEIRSQFRPGIPSGIFPKFSASYGIPSVLRGIPYFRVQVFHMESSSEFLTKFSQDFSEELLQKCLMISHRSLFWVPSNSRDNCFFVFFLYQGTSFLRHSNMKWINLRRNSQGKH